MYRDADQPTYRRGHLICIGLLIIGVIITFILRYTLIRENRRRDNISIDKHDYEAAVEEPCDRVTLPVASFYRPCFSFIL